MANNEVTTTEILDFLKEHMVTKEELNEVKDQMVTQDNLRLELKRFATKEELDDKLTNFKSDILISIDRFAKLHETLDLELVSLRNKYNRLEERLELVESKLGIA